MTETSDNTSKYPETEKPRLLIVEDDPGISNQLKWGLSKEYQISTACDLETTLAFLKKEVPQVVTLDLGLPPKPNDGEIGYHRIRGQAFLDGVEVFDDGHGVWCTYDTG